VTRVHPPMRRMAGLAVGCAVLLSGCGAVPDLNPGVAVRVGDETVSTGAVSDLADDYCDAVAPQLEGQPVPRHYLNGQVAGSLGMRNAADQLMAERDVTIDALYDQAVEQAELDPDLTESERAAIVEVQGSEVYVAAAEVAVGRAALGGAASDEEAQAAGQEEFLAWIEEHDILVDPRYGIAVEEGQVVLADTSLSVGVSGTAEQASAETPDSTYTAALPATQRCG
jgi:hypothetical protein